MPTTEGNPFFVVTNAMWPDLANQQAYIAPARNGMDRETGKLLQGWAHTEQSMSVIFATPYHERVLRRWVGSFVPMILGESTVPRIITRFFWALAMALDCWEPCYRVKTVFYMGQALEKWSPMTTLAAADLIRLGEAIFREEGIYFPRGHLGDFTPYERRQSGLVGRGHAYWDVVQIGNS